MSSCFERTTEIATLWLSHFSDGFASGNVDQIAECFLLDGWLRDILVLSWNFRSLEGREKITGYLKENFSAGSIRNFKIDTRVGLTPEQYRITPSRPCVRSGFTFESDILWGSGYFHLVRDDDGDWRALSCFIMGTDIKGHEETSREDGLYGGHTLAWENVLHERHQINETSPHVLVIGAGQTGLNIAARFKQMNIPTLVIESHARVGDNWRKRYPTLTLHTPRSHHPLLYAPYPTNWPVYTPKEKLADWMEQYAISQDLTIWLKSRSLNNPLPSYDPKTRRWTITIDHDGELVTLHPAHIILATGTLGAPRMPDINMESFKGTILHGSQFNGAHPFTGKRVIVVGAGNTGADVCQDLVFHKAASVTMVQRSSTLIVPQYVTRIRQERQWPEPNIVPTEISDFKFSAIPLKLLRKIARELRLGGGGIEGPDAELYKGLKARGLEAHDGEEHEGNFFQIFERFGGYWVEVGCSPLIISGQVKVKHGVEVAQLKEEAVVFTDGSELPADVVIFATGYHSIRDSMVDLFGHETIERTGQVWGLDDEGEIKGCYRPSGQPGLWYGAGDFYQSRFASKPLAIQIKAMELGLMPQEILDVKINRGNM